MGGPKLFVKRLYPTTELPRRMSEAASGLDLHAWIAHGERLMLPGERLVVPTGVAVAIPVGYEGQVRPRSGLARDYGITVLNAPGTIDADFRGEVHVILINHGRQAFPVRHGDRIAQLVIVPVVHTEVEVVDELDETPRGEGGFGSTGVR